MLPKWKNLKSRKAQSVEDGDAVHTPEGVNSIVKDQSEGAENSNNISTKSAKNRRFIIPMLSVPAAMRLKRPSTPPVTMNEDEMASVYTSPMSPPYPAIHSNDCFEQELSDKHLLSDLKSNRPLGSLVRRMNHCMSETKKFVTNSRNSKQNNLKLGTPVATAFGAGVVVDHDKRRELYTIRLFLHANAVAYVYREAIYCQLKARIGDQVHTRYGVGIVKAYRHIDRTYEIHIDKGEGEGIFQLCTDEASINLLWDCDTHPPLGSSRRISTMSKSVSSSHAPTVIRRQNSKRYSSVVSMISTMATSTNNNRGTIVGRRVITEYGPGIVAKSPPKTPSVVVVELACKATAYLQTSAIIQSLVAIVGDEVETPFGTGNVLSYREQDGVYKIQLLSQCGCMCYIHEDLVERTVVSNVKRMSRMGSRIANIGGGVRNKLSSMKSLPRRKTTTVLGSHQSEFQTVEMLEVFRTVNKICESSLVFDEETATYLRKLARKQDPELLTTYQGSMEKGSFGRMRLNSQVFARNCIELVNERMDNKNGEFVSASVA